MALATFRLPDADIWQITVPDAAGIPVVTLTLWPSIQRVDARGDALMVVITNVTGVELVEGVEAVFRRENGEYLIVPIGGKVIVRA
jgi:hypothetical protein